MLPFWPKSVHDILLPPHHPALTLFLTSFRLCPFHCTVKVTYLNFSFFTTSAPRILTHPLSSLSFTNVFYLRSAEFHCSTLLSKAYLCLSKFPSACSVSTDHHVLFRYSPQRVWARPSACPLPLPTGEPRLSNSLDFACKIWLQATLTVNSLGNSSFDLGAECLSVPLFQCLHVNKV